MRLTLALLLALASVHSGGLLYGQPEAPASIEAKPVAAVPRLIRFSGSVRQTGEKPLVGVAELNFALFREEAGGEPLWFETQIVEIDAQGRYQVLLGAMHPDGLPVDLFTSGEARWLSIMVGKAEQPRVLLVSVPYALKAADAESLGGKPATAFVATEQLKEQVATAMSDPTIAQRSLDAAVLASTGGGDTPPALINETVPATFTCTSASNCILATQNGTGHAVYAQAMGTSGTTYGLYATSASTSGRGVFGHATATTGATYGMRGQSSSTSGYGLYGLATALTGVTHGVAGSSSSTSGRGIFGDASAGSGLTFGILGQSASTGGVGLMGSSTAVTGTTIGVRALVNSSSGTGAVIDNLGGGKLISARTTGFVEKFSVDGSGNVMAALGTFTAPSGTAVWGNNPTVSSNGFLGTYADSRATGVYGNAPGTTGRGVLGRNTTNGGYGELGTTAIGFPTGVYGNASYYGVWGDGALSGVIGTNTTYGSQGILGTTYGESPTGVYGYGGSYGVFGNSPTGIGVYGAGPTYGIGVFGKTGSGYGVYGEGDNGVRGVGNAAASSTGVVGVGGAEGTGVYGEGAYGVYSAGDFGASGSKSAVVALSDNRVVSLYAVESPENWFEDFGTATLVNGVGEVGLDATFALTVNTELSYHVFLTPKGDCEGLYMAQQTPRGFQVRELRRGRSNVNFDYRIVARRRGYENVRLQEVDADQDTVAEIRGHGRARTSRPSLRVPKKPASPREEQAAGMASLPTAGAAGR